MLTLSFMGFLVLLMISLVISSFLHFGLKYYVEPGLWSFLSMVILGYMGGMLGPLVFGNWFAGFMYGGIYILPAMLGTLAFLILLVDVTKTLLHHRHA